MLPKVAGIETEYGIFISGAVESDPFLASKLLLQQYKNLVRFKEINPAPIFESYSTTQNNLDYDTTDYDWMLSNGARFYIDHAHPEYSTPEAITPRDIVAADRAGEMIVDFCREVANKSGVLPASQQIYVYKNNSDQKGNSYGCHENYLVLPETFMALTGGKGHMTAGLFVTYLVTRIILNGAGKVGFENSAPWSDFQLSQRADFFETLTGPQTTYHRPIINTRDEPHADPIRFRRLHVITGDANMAEYSTYLKVGVTQLILMMLEDNYIKLDMELADPITAMQIVSRDITFNEKLELKNGGKASALEIQKIYLVQARRYLMETRGSEILWEIITIWEDALDRLTRDWRLLSTRLDWAIKFNILERYLRDQGTSWDAVTRWQTIIEQTLDFKYRNEVHDRDSLVEVLQATYPDQFQELKYHVKIEGLNWEDYWKQRDIYFTLRRLDLEYHDISRGTNPKEMGLFYNLQKRGVIERLISDRDIQHFIEMPPTDTRAHLRGHCIANFLEHINIIDWSDITFNEPLEQRMQCLNLTDPISGTKAQLDPLLKHASDLHSFFRLLKDENFQID